MSEGLVIFCLVFVFTVVPVLIIVAVVRAVKKSKKRKLFAKQEKEKQEQQRIERENKDKERREKIKRERELIDNVINSNPVFNNGKRFDGAGNNVIIFSRTGEVGIFNSDNIGIKLIKVSDIRSMRYEVEDKTYYNCVLSINDFDNPVIKICLSIDKEEGKNMYDEIKQTYSLLKSQSKEK